jgi:hypothetical protein
MKMTGLMLLGLTAVGLTVLAPAAKGQSLIDLPDAPKRGDQAIARHGTPGTDDDLRPPNAKDTTAQLLFRCVWPLSNRRCGGRSRHQPGGEHSAGVAARRGGYGKRFSSNLGIAAVTPLHATPLKSVRAGRTVPTVVNARAYFRA